jgi:sugar phosphate isomerase/epimerase
MFLLSTSSLSGYWLHKIFLLAKQANYDGIDLSVDFDAFDTCDASYINNLIEAIDIPVLSITAPERRLTKKHFDLILTLATDLNVSIVNVHPPHRLDREKDWFGDYLKIVAAKYPRITINIINAPPKTWLFIISEYGDARPETIKKITEHTALSIENVDPSSGVDLMKTFVLLGSTMNFIYLSDKTEEESRLFPGEGNMPLESLLIKLKELQYSGYFTLDIHPRYLNAGDDDLVIKRLEQSKNFLNKYF